MRSRIGKGYATVAVVAVAIALLSVSMVAPAISATEDFSIFNSGWNGTSGLAVMAYRTGKLVPTFEVESTGTEITVTQAALTTIAPDPRTGALIILGPTKEFTDAEGKLVGDFVRDGGRLVLADDFGTGNSLLSKMGAGSRFSGQLVMDLAFEKQPEFSVVFDIAPDPLMTNISTLLFNHPSSVTVNTSTTAVIARSSVASWRDVNGNRLQDPGEPMGPFPLVARERLGLGTILLLSDPSVLINGMMEYMDNDAFAENLVVEVCRERTEVYFDESHRVFFDPVSATLEFTEEISTTAKALIAATAFVLTLWIATDLVDDAVLRVARRIRTAVGLVMWALMTPFSRKRPVPEKKPLSLEETIDMVSRERPDMRLGIIRYMLREKDRHSKTLMEQES